MCNAALLPSCDRRGDKSEKHQESKRVMFGCQSALVSPQSRRSHLKSVAVPVFARLPHGSEAWTGTCITDERVQDRGVVFLGGCGCGRRRIRVPMLLGI